MNNNDTVSIYANTVTKVAREFTRLSCECGHGWRVTTPRALPATNCDGERVIVRIEQGSARVVVTFELVEDPQWTITIDIGGLPSKWDSDEVETYTTAISIANRVARLLQHHFA